ncbi:Palmitoyltransferase ZDHHC22 [Varanus komodoensis]|nr:Palmitoyltransferase ZDHHC22 [Varanus komodoensis]
MAQETPSDLLCFYVSVFPLKDTILPSSNEESLAQSEDCKIRNATCTMLVLRFLNVVAPAYFLCISLVTFALQLFLFIPSMLQDPSGATPLFSSALLHGVLFLFLSANALGNYILVIQNSPEDLGKSVDLARGADWLDGSHSSLDSAVPGTHFCRLCARVTQRHDHHCFFTGNCIGNRNMRNFIMFCLYTSLACLDSLVTGVAYISAVLSTSFANPLAFLTLLPRSISQFFSGKYLPSYRRSISIPFLLPNQFFCSWHPKLAGCTAEVALKPPQTPLTSSPAHDCAALSPVSLRTSGTPDEMDQKQTQGSPVAMRLQQTVTTYRLAHGGALLGSEMFVILMLYLWLGIGLACAGFCCHQVLLIVRGQTRYQVRKGMAAQARPWKKNLEEVFGKRWLLGLLIPVLNVGSDYHRQK